MTLDLQGSRGTWRGVNARAEQRWRISVGRRPAQAAELGEAAEAGLVGGGLDGDPGDAS